MCRCDQITSEKEEIKALGHTEEIIPAVEATCDKVGLTEGKKCSVCNVIVEEQKEVPTIPHKEIEIAAHKATCTTIGYTSGKMCSVCNSIT